MRHLSNLVTPKNAKILSQFIIYTVIIGCVYNYYQFYLHGDAGVEIWYLPQTLAELVNQKSYWQLISPSFVHFTEWHLISNCLLWWYLSRVLGEISSIWLLALLISSALISNIAQWSVSNSLFGGLSGVVAALFGFFASYQKLKPNGLFFIQWSFVGIFVGFLVVVATGHFGVYSNAAHFAGLGWGAIIGFMFVKLSKIEQ